MSGETMRMPNRVERRTSEDAVRARRSKNIRRGGVPKNWLSEMFAKEGGRCHYCKVLMAKKPIAAEEWRRPTLDHKKPLSAGGTNKRDNLCACCKRCNNWKADMSYKAFVSLVALTKAHAMSSLANGGVPNASELRRIERMVNQ